MATHTSAGTRGQASHVTQTPHVNQTTRAATIINALKQRAQAVLNDESIDAQTRVIIRYGLETNDPWLADFVQRADAEEKIADTLDFSQGSRADMDGPDGPDGPDGQKIEVQAEKVKTLAEIICSAGEESAGALFVLMGTLQHSTHPEVLANTAKHLAFTRCGEFNLFGMVDAQIAVVEGELFAGSTHVS